MTQRTIWDEIDGDDEVGERCEQTKLHLGGSFRISRAVVESDGRLAERDLAHCGTDLVLEAAVDSRLVLLGGAREVGRVLRHRCGLGGHPIRSLASRRRWSRLGQCRSAFTRRYHRFGNRIRRIIPSRVPDSHSLQLTGENSVTGCFKGLRESAVRKGGSGRGGL